LAWYASFSISFGRVARWATPCCPAALDSIRGRRRHRRRRRRRRRGRGRSRPRRR